MIQDLKENYIYPYGLLGWRSWRINKGTLCSAVIGHGAWGKSTLTASCELGHVHNAPNSFCDCGLYAYHFFVELLNNRIRYFDYEPSTVFVHGLVVGSGAIELHEDGFRAEKMQTLGLINNGSTQIKEIANKYKVGYFTDFEQAIDKAFIYHSQEKIKFLKFQDQLNFLADFPFKTTKDSQSQLHSINDQPAIIYPNGRQEWYSHGKLHRQGNPAAIEKTDKSHETNLALRLRKIEEYYQEGVLTRENDLPAMLVRSPLNLFSAEMWFKNGDLHREGDQPAIVSGEIKEWYKNGTRHRDLSNGPAVCTGSEYSEWWQEGKRLKMNN